MLVSAISKNEIFQISLPEKVKGQYWLYTSSEKGEKLVSIEGQNDKWILKANNKNKIYDTKNKEIKTIQLQPMQLNIVANSEGEKTFVFAEPISDDRKIYKKYVFKDKTKLTIGRATDNDIVFDSKVVSSHHATISYSNNQWTVEDTKSANGTFVNGKRVDKAKLKFGDVVLIMGLKIILGKNFIALNNPDNRVKVTKKLSSFVPQTIENNDIEEEDEVNVEQYYFYRSPRFKREIETLKINIDNPPNSPITDEQPLILVLGTSMTMGMMSIVTLSNAVLNNNIMSMAMGGSMLLGTVLIPVITKSYEKNSKFKKEQIRQKKYKEYLDDVFVEIDEARQLQEEILHENIVPLSNCENRILNVKRNLWERSFGQNDFLNVRLGIGELDMDADISFSDKKFSLDDDNLQEEMYMLGEKQKKLLNVPISYSIFDDYISGVIGKRDEIKEFAKGIIFQLASMYSYDEVKFVFVYDESESSDFDFAKWLPHCWSNDGKFRFIATDINECKEVSSYLDRIIDSRSNNQSSEKSINDTYYVIFSMDRSLGLRVDAINKILESKDNINFSVINFYGELKYLPKECSRVIELNGKESSIFDKNDETGQVIKFDNDIKINNDANILAKKLSNIYIDSQNSSFKLPDMITFMNLFEVGKVEHLNVSTRWKENDPTKSLAAAVGVNTLGDTFMLDLHEKFHGPHGLVAGMTGSGKSEFIITYILSLAVNYHPDEVQFVLIDYKGGGMAKSFEHLPHTVGIITNLDGAAIKRSLVSIESELKRRQAIFSEASKKVQMSNIDIYKYQKLYREGKVDEPLSHLFIISDEFAELKTQQPEFMTQLVSAARIGRSLGVHLILATQKPSGVVDDQIWSNSRFRVCLKVQERADSQDMLKRPDAAELVETGRFYLQVGYNEMFELGQSAWSGAPYYPSDVVLKEKDESVQIIDTNAHVIGSSSIDRNKGRIQNPNKQVDEITQYLSNTASEENIKPRLLWLEPIKPIILLDQVVKKYKYKPKEFVLNPVIGEYDDPAHQRQCLLNLPLSKNGNTIVFGSAGSGKTSFLNAMIYSLINEHTPDEVNLYLLDFASETMRAFKDAPHVGEVIVSHEEEKVNNLFKMLHKECEHRKKLFSDYGGDYASFIANSGSTLPSIVVAINNYAAFSELYEDLDFEITNLTRDGIKYGIYFVITAAAVNNVRFRLSQNFNLHYALQLNDETDYSTIVGRTEGLYPSKYKGRGLVKIEELYEFQTASLVDNGSVFSYIKDHCAELSKNWKGKKAKSVPVLPENVDADFLKQYIEDNSSNLIPVGVETSSISVNIYDFGSRYINYLLSTGDESMKYLCELFKFDTIEYKHKGFVFDPGRLIDGKFKNYKVANSSQLCDKYVSELFDIVLERNNSYKTAIEKGKKPKKYDHLYVYINSLETLYSLINEDNKGKLSLILEKGSKNYNISILIADKVSSLSSLSYEAWYKNNVSNNDAIWIGAGICEQYQLKLNNTTREMRDHISNQYGYIVTNGDAVKIKVLYGKKG